MTRIARISDNQQVSIADFQGLAKHPRDTSDRIVSQAVHPGRAYYGGAVSRTGTTEVTVAAPFSLFAEGGVFSGDADVRINLLSKLPLAGNQRIIAVVLQIKEEVAETESRDFLVSVQSTSIITEARPTATVIVRSAVVATIDGDPAPSPSRPAITAGNTVIAWVTLSSTEVLADGIYQDTDAQLVPLSDVTARLKIAEGILATASPAIEGLKGDVARLSEQSIARDTRSLIQSLLESVSRLEAISGMPAGQSFAGTDYYLNTTKSDTGHVSYDAKVEEGIRFSDADRLETQIQLQTPGQTDITVHPSGMLLPKNRNDSGERSLIFSTMRRDAEIPFSTGGAQTITFRTKAISRRRIRFGKTFTISSSSKFWASARYDSVAGVFRRGSETFAVVTAEDLKDVSDHKIIRLSNVFLDDYADPYWDRIYSENTYTGNVIAQSYLAPRSGWINGVDIGFTRLDTSGDVRLLLTEVNDQGYPDTNAVLAQTNVSYANLRKFSGGVGSTIPQTSQTSVTIDPTFLEAGRRYAVVLMAAANHWIAVTDGNKVTGGAFFTNTDGVWSAGSAQLDMCMQVGVSLFYDTRVVVNLQNWNLSGGMAALDLIGEIIAPAPTSITFEVRAGGGWIPLTANGPDPSIFNGLPASVDARMIFQGTLEMMPGIRLSGSFATRTRPKTTFTHISSAFVAPANVDEVIVKSILEGYVEADHNCVGKLRVGSGFTTVVNATATTDRVLADGSIERTFSFTGLTPTTTWKVQHEGATVSALSVYTVAHSTVSAYPA